MRDSIADNVVMHNFAEIAFSILVGKKVRMN